MTTAYDREFLERLFESDAYRHWAQRGWDPCFYSYMEEGFFNLWELPITVYDEPATGTPEYEEFRDYDNGGKSDHSALKWSAARWLSLVGSQDVIQECRMAYGRRADLYARDFRWVVECGHTDPKCVVDCFEAGLEAFCLLPFQIESALVNRVFIFTSTAPHRDLLQKTQQEKQFAVMREFHARQRSRRLGQDEV